MMIALRRASEVKKKKMLRVGRKQEVVKVGEYRVDIDFVRHKGGSRETLYSILWT